MMPDKILEKTMPPLEAPRDATGVDEDVGGGQVGECGLIVWTVAIINTEL
jgi:hypothetical protein